MNIVCPACLVRQNVLIYYSQSPLVITQKNSDESLKLKPGTPFTTCAFSRCQHVITGNDLSAVTTQTVKGPGDIQKAMKLTNLLT